MAHRFELLRHHPQLLQLLHKATPARCAFVTASLTHLLVAGSATVFTVVREQDFLPTSDPVLE